MKQFDLRAELRGESGSFIRDYVECHDLSLDQAKQVLAAIVDNIVGEDGKISKELREVLMVVEALVRLGYPD